ncbi:uncharacterized protein MONOS_9924 [Monocercomonoides exilis]|uniref:uncharacterized protein n=1 Tax=Monocercomonoides exilis TaxID=2049356 RepID=UPI00355A9089|nr:hypothetical protein MONOS_9924 [Monocercomonoides exilis]|eukprot:MONOS_9924.1-p1 / transcript=MONOS_9924.1 / gene=MONOS_9924 / organism=Monocercomonoides_exilis_PA203 / gene_product=unspecified product / transcript_product=unspecified product / location=Mono_scaffold00427:50093-50461(-) / protein_length=74 / sequence_SO=supercontig / SO=protein_coding / is_pseudo=false
MDILPTQPARPTAHKPDPAHCTALVPRYTVTFVSGALPPTPEEIAQPASPATLPPPSLVATAHTPTLPTSAKL